MKKIITIFSLFSFILLPSLAIASEATGTLTTGVESGVGSMDGVVIGPPTASPAAGEYHADQSVILSAEGSTAMCYSTDGTDPVCSGSSSCSVGTLFSEAITVSSTQTIESISCYGNSSSSSVASSTYELTCAESSVSNGSVGAYPECEITCNGSYSLDGNSCVSGGSGSTSSNNSSGGSTYVAPTSNNETKIQTLSTTSDGAVMNIETTTTIEYNIITKIVAEAVITPAASSTVSQIIKLDSSKMAQVKDITLELSPSILASLVSTYGTGKDIKVTITSKPATDEQKTDNARGGRFLVGYDVFSITIEVGDEKLETFSDLLSISFDISDIESRENIKTYYYDYTIKKWQVAGEGGAVVNDRLTLGIDHLTDYSLLRDIVDSSTVIEENNNTTAGEVLAETLDSRQQQWKQVENDASIAYTSGSDLTTLLAHNNVSINIEAQKKGMEKYIPNLTSGIENLTNENKYAVNNFIVYGTISTRILGAGERAGVVNSYKKAFGKLPITQSEWEDCIAIGNGRWPGEKSEKAEGDAKVEFKKVYKRDADMNNANDNAAVTVMAYGLRPSNRNLESEKVAIKTFEHIYEYAPSSALDWDIVRAIAYSGATR